MEMMPTEQLIVQKNEVFSKQPKKTTHTLTNTLFLFSFVGLVAGFIVLAFF